MRDDEDLPTGLEDEPDRTLESEMARAADGCVDALGPIYDALAPLLRRYMLRRGVMAARIDELVRTVVLELHRGRGHYIRDADVMPWAFASARYLTAQGDGDEASLRDEVMDLVLLGLDAGQIAKVLDQSTRTICAVVQGGRAAIERSLASRTAMSFASSVESSNEQPDLRASGYLVGAEIGAGAMGRVYRALHETLGIHHAIKVMRDVPGDDRDAVLRFRREAALMCGIDHRSIVKVHTADVLADGRAWYAMELLEGRTVASMLDERGRMAWPEVAGIVRQLCDGLALVHAKGIVHRDIKPSNCMLVGDDRRHPTVKLFDFGVARLADTGVADRDPLGSGVALGTSAYLAPELLRGASVDARADVYSLGVMMFEMLTGALPFDGTSSESLFTAKLIAPLPSLRSAAPTIAFPLGIERVVQRALARDPRERFSTVVELADAIAALGESGRGRLPLSAWTRHPTQRMLITASLSAMVASVGTVALVREPEPVSARIEAALAPEHVEAALAPARGRLAACREGSASAPAGARLLVLGATGQVIKVELLGDALDRDVAACMRGELFTIRFPRFVVGQQQLEVRP